ncbi:MAG: hypothetical protein IRY97_10665 [Thermomicrobiaceae bacterium]|nr:hypothetical protein [Thermomicrobiaceae bacterium]
MTVGSVEPLKRLHARYGERVQFVDVLVRQAHPGPAEPPYQTMEQKLEDARRYRREEGIPWPVVADDVEGTVHQGYGGLADPSYLIGADGRVAFYDVVTYAPTLDRAIRDLLGRGGSGVVAGGVDRVPHLLPALTGGWPGLARGLPQSVTDLMLAAPGAPLALWLGYQLRPLLAPLTLRDRPLPWGVRAALLAAVALIVARLARRGR